MQRIYPCGLTPEEYLEMEWHRFMTPEDRCPICGRGRLRRHSVYWRGITSGRAERVQPLEIPVARFLCDECERTVSYLPSFCLSYRVVSVGAFEAFLEDRRELPEVQHWEGLLRTYRKRMERFARKVIHAVGRGFGREPPPGEGLWRWLKEVHGSLQTAMHRLVTQFRITLFKRYQCHQPATGF